MEELFKLYPYCEIDGLNTFRDSEIKELYFRMISEGSNIYIDNQIGNGEDFIRHMKYGSALYVAYYDEDPFGFVYLDEFTHKTARVHFCVFKEFHGTVANAESCAKSIEIILSTKDSSGDFMYDVLIGIIPSKNKVAVKFVEKIGGKISGVVPCAMWNAKEHKSVDGTVVYFRR